MEGNLATAKQNERQRPEKVRPAKAASMHGKSPEKASIPARQFTT
jgi:hypothetical protein